MEILTFLKVLGIILSGSSIIGSERLSKLEEKIRVWVKKPEGDLHSEKSPFRVFNLIVFVGFGVQILFSILLFLLFVYLSFGIPLPNQITDFLISIEHLNPIAKVILILALTSMLIRPFFEIQLPYGRIPPDGYTLSMWVSVVLALITAGILRIITFPYLFIDNQLQKRKIESTLAVLGIILAISGELMDYFIK